MKADGNGDVSAQVPTPGIVIDLTGRTAVVTGATGELGRTIVRTLAKAGADVAIHYHKQAERGAALQQELTQLGRRALAVQADITTLAAVEVMRDRICAELAPPDIVITAAVTQYAWTSVLDQNIADYESQFRSCVLHNVNMIKAFTPKMIERSWGRFIALNTECSMQNHPNQSAYVSGKRGMDGVLRVFAREVGGHGITVNQVAPGWTISEGVRAAGAERQEFYEKDVPLKRRGTDQDIANAVAFLASDLAAFLTGVYLPVCGGNVMPAI